MTPFVEFRPLLDQVVRRLEGPQFEVAVSGRVSSGKSSLLNHIAGIDVLPVGVTPVTAVPTRLARDRRGETCYGVYEEGEEVAVDAPLGAAKVLPVPCEAIALYNSHCGSLRT